MKDFVILGAVLFVLWYALRKGVFAQLGGGLAPQPSRGFFNFETPYGNYAGGL